MWGPSLPCIPHHHLGLPTYCGWDPGVLQYIFTATIIPVIIQQVVLVIRYITLVYNRVF